MRVLLDHCVPATLARRLPGHAVRSAADLGWDRYGDDALVERCRGRFDVVLTVDRLFCAARAPPADIAVIRLRARMARLVDLEPLVPAILEELKRPARGWIVVVGDDPRQRGRALRRATRSSRRPSTLGSRRGAAPVSPTGS